MLLYLSCKSINSCILSWLGINKTLEINFIDHKWKSICSAMNGTPSTVEKNNKAAIKHIRTHGKQKRSSAITHYKLFCLFRKSWRGKAPFCIPMAYDVIFALLQFYCSCYHFLHYRRFAFLVVRPAKYYAYTIIKLNNAILIYVQYAFCCF